MPNRADTAGNTKAFIYPVMDHWEKSELPGTRQILTADLSVHSRTRQVGGSIIPRALNGEGDLLPTGGSSALRI